MSFCGVSDSEMTHSGDIMAGFPRLYLLGRFSLIGADGRDVTPKSKKTCALLALLALSPRGTRTRVWLRDKLWSESDEEKASGSLRQTIRDLKRALTELEGAILTVDRNSLSLKLDSLWIDLRSIHEARALPPGLGAEVDLLEGFDIADEEFEDWLAMERAVWADLRDSLQDSVAVPAIAPAAPEGGFGQRPIYPHLIVIGLLPSIVHGSDQLARYVGDYVTESVACTLAEYQPVQIVNLGDRFGGDAGDALSPDPDYLIRTRALVVGSKVSLTFLIYEASNRSLALSQSVQIPQQDLVNDDFMLANQFVSQNVDHLAKIILQPGPRRAGVPHDQGTLIGYRILASMFDLDAGRIQQSQSMLERVQDREASSLFHSLGAYASSFSLGENIGGWDQGRLEQTEKFARDVMQANPFNSISLACIGHTMGFVLNRHDIAAEIFARAVKLNPMQAFVWDHLALHRLYNGDLNGARAASDRAVMLGRYSPISYTYETTACMISALQGDHHRAVEIGSRSLMKQPRFHAAMRYTLSALGHLGDGERAVALRGQLLGIDPSFANRDTQEMRFRLPLKEARGHVLNGIAKAGL